MTCPGSHAESQARLEPPEWELGHPHLTGFLQKNSPFSPNMQIYPPSPTTTKHGVFLMFSHLALEGLATFQNTVPQQGHVLVPYKGFPWTLESTPPRRLPARVGKALQPLARHHGLPQSQAWFMPGRSRSQGLLRMGASEPGSQSWPWSGASHRGPKATPLQSSPLFQLSKANAVCTLSPALGGGLMTTYCLCEQPAPTSTLETPHPGSGTASGQRLGTARPQRRQGAALV